MTGVFPFSSPPREGKAAQQTDGGSLSLWPRPRVRRPLDGARLLAAAVALVVLLVLAVFAIGQLQTLAGIVPAVRSGLFRAVLSFVNVAVSVAVLGVLVGILIDSLRFHRFSLTAASLACAVGVLGGYGLGLLVGVLGGHQATTLLTGPVRESAELPIIAALALIIGADLHRRRWWATARLTVAAAVACALVLGSLTVPSAVYALLVGATAGLGVRVAIGVVPARPSIEVVRSVLAGAGFEFTDLNPLEEAAGRIRYRCTGPDAAEVRVTVVDPDRGGIPFARRTWRLLRLSTAVVGRPALTVRGQLERQALADALAKSAGVAAPEMLGLLAAGPGLMLVERTLVGVPLAAAAEPDAARGAAAAFAALRRLHEVGIAHGALTADGVVLLADDRAGFADFSVAQPAANDVQRGLDVVALLVAAATRAGATAAVSALRSAYALSAVAEARLAALLQPVILPWQARREVRGTPLLGELRAAIAGPQGPAGVADVPRLQRLRPRTVISVVGATVAAYLLATQLSQVSIAGALREAQPGWLAVALAGSAVTYLGAALALQAFVSTGLPLARTALVQLASSFVALVTPPAVGHVGLNIRYLQKAGVPTATAAADVAVKEAVTVAVTVPLLVVCGWLSGVSGSRLALLPSGNVLIVLGAAAVVVGLIALLPVTRRLLRPRLEPLIRRILPQLIATASNPRRLGTAVVGVLILNGGYVLALDASLRAFSTSLALPTLVVVYLAASTLGSAAPTPGGLGAVEAALVAGLSATGIPVAAAITAVLAFRTATFWLPAPLGWGAFVLLQRRDRI